MHPYARVVVGLDIVERRMERVGDRVHEGQGIAIECAIAADIVPVAVRSLIGYGEAGRVHIGHYIVSEIAIRHRGELHLVDTGGTGYDGRGIGIGAVAVFALGGSIRQALKLRPLLYAAVRIEVALLAGLAA